MYVWMYLPTPPHEKGVIQGQFFMRGLTGLNSVTFF